MPSTISDPTLDTTRDTQPLTAFRDNPAELLRQFKTTHRPITLTVDGHPDIVLQEASAYQRLLDLAAQADATDGIRQGLEELRRGEGRPASEFFDEMRAKYAIPR